MEAIVVTRQETVPQTTFSNIQLKQRYKRQLNILAVLEYNATNKKEIDTAKSTEPAMLNLLHLVSLLQNSYHKQSSIERDHNNFAFFFTFYFSPKSDVFFWKTEKFKKNPNSYPWSLSVNKEIAAMLVSPTVLTNHTDDATLYIADSSLWYQWNNW